tara:strand:- start:160 stop:714 length:555 start_codon:yes stop_codon:yes gene_type:complete
MLVDEKRFDFLPKKKWKSLSNNELRNLRSYKNYYAHYKKTSGEIDELKQLIEEKKKQTKIYYHKLMRINYEIDHLRSDYHFSFSIYKVKDKNYYNCSISRRGHSPKNGTLGSPILIDNHLRQHFIRRKDKISELDKIGWDRFIRNEVNDTSGKSKVRDRIIDMIMEDKTLKSFTINRKLLFPTK